MAGSGGSGRKKSGSNAAAASKNHAAASNCLSLDHYFPSSAKKDKGKKAGNSNSNSNSNSSNANSSTPTFNPDQAARRMMGQETPQRRNDQPAAAAAGTTANGTTSNGSSTASPAAAAASASTSPAVNPNRAAIERARQGKASHKHRSSSPSKNSRKRQKSSTAAASSSSTAAAAASSSASSSLSESPRGSGGATTSRSPTRSLTSRKSSSSSSKTPTPAKKGPTIDLSMDSDDDHTGGNAANAASNAKPAASKSAGTTAGKKRKNGPSENGDDDGDDDGVFVIDDGDGSENRINGSEDSTLAKQQAKEQQRKRSKKGLGNVAGPTRGGTTGSEVIDMAKSIDEDDDDEVVHVAAASAGAATTAAAAPTGKRKRGGVKSKVNNGTAAAEAKKPAAAAASAAAQSIPAAASSDSDVVVVPSSTAAARSSTSTTAQASPPAAAASAAAPGASSPAVSNAASSSSQTAATDETHGLALVRIDRVVAATSRDAVDLTPEARDITANLHPLRPNAILGRTGINNTDPQKVDLGIGSEADGVSRRHIRILHISVGGSITGGKFNRQRHRPYARATVFNSASSSIGAAHYGHLSGEVNPSDIPLKYDFHGAGKEFALKVGDCIVFDAYNGTDTGSPKDDSTRPAHVFRLVRYDKRDASQAGPSPPSDPAPAPALVTDSTAGGTLPITTGAAKRSEDAPISNSAPSKPSALSPSRSRKASAARKDQNSSDPPHIPTSAASAPSSDKVVDTADIIDKTVPRLGMPNIVVASMTERQHRPPAAAKPAENSYDKAKSNDAPRADGPSLDTSKTESAAAAEASTKKPSSKCKENATKLPPQPSVGDRFRVNFEELKNFFGVIETQWFCGTVEEVSSGNNRYEVNVRYDDGGIGRHEYPADDVGRLVDSKGFGAAPTSSASQGRSRRKTQADDSSQSMERVESAIYPEGAKEAVFDPNPSELFVGDLVDCFYQNGMIAGAWYRGRVARVQISSEAGKPTLFDVAYNDQEYEKNIPLEHGNVRLFQRGSDDLSWLYGADVLRRLGRSKNAAKVGTVKSSPSGTSSSSMPKVVVELNDGTFEDHVYTDIAQEMFATYLQFVPAGKVKVWPTASAAVNANTGVRSVKIESSETHENEEPPASDDEEHDDLGITKSKSATRKTNAATFTSTQLDDMLNNHEASQDSQQSYPDSPVRGANDKPRAKEMHSSMANALWSALNSAEPSSSANLLRHSAAFHHTLPNSALSQKTFNLMMTGPQNEGISFRDPNRMELAYDYMRLCLASSHRVDVGPNITSFAPSCWEDVQHILAQPLKETEQMGTFHSIKESVSTSSMRRLGEALHTAASGLSCFDELLKDELSDGKEAGTTSNPRRLYMVNPTVRTALDANVREALKVAVRHAAQCWVRHGHFVIGDGDDLLPAESADEDWCAMEAKRCLDSLGSIISHLAWLYCAEEGIELSDNDCSFAICDALRNEFDSLHQDSADFGHIGKKKPSVASWKKYSKRAKVWFILSLDNSFASPLQQNLAKMLSLSKDLKSLL